MNYIKSCEFNLDTACAEVKLIDGVWCQSTALP